MFNKSRGLDQLYGNGPTYALRYGTGKFSPLCPDLVFRKRDSRGRSRITPQAQALCTATIIICSSSGVYLACLSCMPILHAYLARRTLEADLSNRCRGVASAITVSEHGSPATVLSHGTSLMSLRPKEQ